MKPRVAFIVTDGEGEAFERPAPPRDDAPFEAWTAYHALVQAYQDAIGRARPQTAPVSVRIPVRKK